MPYDNSMLILIYLTNKVLKRRGSVLKACLCEIYCKSFCISMSRQNKNLLDYVLVCLIIVNTCTAEKTTFDV